ncbi:2312_t:CDS:1, partial [Dentiscutata erythropus]
DNLNDKFLKWVVVDQQSFLLSENAEFIKFLQELDPVTVSPVAKCSQLG